MIRILFLLSLHLLIAFFTDLSADDKKADITLVITSDLKGAIRECQCLYGQPGGLARRKTIFDQIRRKTPEAFFIESGDLTNERNEIALFIDLFIRLKYDLICPHMIDYDRLYKGVNGEIISGWLPFSFANLKSNYFSSISFTPFIDSEKELLIITFTSLYNQAETDSMPDIYNYQLLNWEETVIRFSDTIRDFKGISVIICNWGYVDPDMPTVPEDITVNLPGIDVIIVGGSGYVEPEVKEESNVLAVYTGSYGEYVLVFDIWKDNNGGISRFEWQAIPTETAAPDSLFTNLIEKVYKSETKTFER
ncbi:MAG: hypothetical protein HQ568_00750 [Calditrichaeota bacterium]|nr:hypothetical protein [Calditrichota bacterium]